MQTTSDVTDILADDQRTTRASIFEAFQQARYSMQVIESLLQTAPDDITGVNVTLSAAMRVVRDEILNADMYLTELQTVQRAIRILNGTNDR